VTVVCPACGSKSLTTKSETDNFTFRSGGVEYPVSAVYPVHECSECGESFLSEAAETARHAATCAAMNRLSPEEIATLRSQLGLSRKGLAELAGFGEASLARWESGELIQSESNDNLLRLLTRAENVRFLKDRRTGGMEPIAGRERRTTLSASVRTSVVQQQSHEFFVALSPEAVERASAQSRVFRLKGMVH
jgi:putative zinc finger/helix-turn-helix YgiT family protein